MGVHQAPQIVGCLDGHAYFLEGHGRGMRRDGRIERVTRHIQLDVVAPFTAAQTHGFAHLFGTVDDDRRGLARVVQLALIAQTAGHRDLERACADARPGKPAGVDLIADRDAEPQLRLGGAVDARESLIEQNFRNARREQRVLLRRRRDQIFRRGDGFERQVPVALHHARHEEQPRGIDHLTACLRHLTGHPGHRPHPVALDEHIAVERRAAAPRPRCALRRSWFYSFQPSSANARSPGIRYDRSRALSTISNDQGCTAPCPWPHTPGTCHQVSCNQAVTGAYRW